MAAARVTRAELAERVEGLTAAFHAQRDAVVELVPPAPDADLAVAWGLLADWARSEHASLSERRAASSDAADGADRAARRVVAELVGTLRGEGIDLPATASFTELRRALGRAEAQTEARLAELDRGAARREELETDVERSRSARSVAAELARHLKADRFQRWLVESAFRELARAASEVLLRLSAGQFSLELNDAGEFVVVDHVAADERRPVRTLSGGETFQASLALALSLSEHVMELAGARGHRALESIFLDEGFGTLDPESLEVVASTMEALGDGGRVVGIVTHVKELADRVPVRFVVWKDARSAHVERVDG